MNPLEAVRLALDTIRTQKLKSAFTLMGVCIGVMFLIAVVSIVKGMGVYMKDDLVGKLIAINSSNCGTARTSTWATSTKPRGVSTSAASDCATTKCRPSSKCCPRAPAMR